LDMLTANFLPFGAWVGPCSGGICDLAHDRVAFSYELSNTCSEVLSKLKLPGGPLDIGI
jgi:hypothetical protein